MVEIWGLTTVICICRINIINKKKRIRLTLHELLHGQGFSWPCIKGDDGVHVEGMSIIGSQQSTHALEEKRHRTLGDMIYDHDNKGCPDLKDSVYLTPTSKNPYDPLPLMCNLATRSGHWSASFSGGRSNWNFNWPKRYDHEKFNESYNWKKDIIATINFQSMHIIVGLKIGVQVDESIP